MKITVQIIVYVLFLASCSTNKSNQLPTSDEGTHYKRINLVVADLNRSLKIYRDILGFSVHAQSESSKGSYSYPVFDFPEAAQLRFCTLDSPDQVRTMALTEVKGISLPSLPRPHMSASVIRVKNIESVMSKIEQLGLKSTTIKVAGSQRGGMFKEQAFVDFDGHLIVLYEYI